LIYCVASMCMCAKAESCLRSICIYVIYEFNMWIKRCYCFVCDCAACKSTWKCEKSINLLHHICSYVCKSWVVPSQYICICCIWVTACMQKRCCSSVYMWVSTCWWSRCYYLTFQLCMNSTCEYSVVTALLMLMRLFSSSDKHNLLKICSQHLVQINLVVNLFTHEFVRFSKVTSVSDKIIRTKTKLQAISDAIAICSKKALKNSEIWMYINSQMILQRLNAKSNVNSRLFDDIQQNLINLRQNQCQICIQWVSSCKNIKFFWKFLLNSTLIMSLCKILYIVASAVLT